jgi:hypothetical protein
LHRCGGGGAEALLEVEKKKKDTEVLEFFLRVAKRLGIVLTFVGVALWAWLSWR